MLQDSTHLSILIERIHTDEAQFNYAMKEHLVNLAEYILSWPGKYSKAEYDEAIRILASYHLAPLASRKVGWKLIARELARPYKARCRRCGLPLTNQLSLEAGHGPVCRRKLGIKQPEKEVQA